jgi:sulfopyruvate decarboxylase alpha subunit
MGSVTTTERTRTIEERAAAAPAYARLIWEGLRRNNIRAIAHLPDATVSPIIELVEADDFFTVTRLNREEEGVGVLTGAYLGGQHGALLFQTSGLGNMVNALAGLAVTYQVPMLLICSPRGVLGEHNPAQLVMGQAIERIFDAVHVPHYWLQDETRIPRFMDMGARGAFSASTPVALIIDTLLTGGKGG